MRCANHILTCEYARSNEYSLITWYSFPRMWAENENPDRWRVFADALVGAVAGAFGGRGSVDVRRSPDGLIHATAPDGRLLVAQPIARPSRPALMDAWQRLLPQAQALDATPVLVMPRVPASLRELAAREQINTVDFAGNASIVAPSLVVHVEGRRARSSRLGPSVDPFAPRSANIVRRLLSDPARAWRQKQLVELAGVSQPQTSKVLAALQELALVAPQEDGGFRVTDSEGLLDAWADAYSYRRQEIVPVHMTGEGIELARELDRRLRAADVRHWFTGLPAAWAYDHFARFRLVSVFVDGDPEIVQRELGLRPAERGANVHLIGVGPQRLEIGHATPDGLRCAHPAQVYVDLLGLPERAREAADHLRPLALRGPA